MAIATSWSVVVVSQLGLISGSTDVDVELIVTLPRDVGAMIPPTRVAKFCVRGPLVNWSRSGKKNCPMKPFASTNYWK